MLYLFLFPKKDKVLYNMEKPQKQYKLPATNAVNSELNINPENKSLSQITTRCMVQPSFHVTNSFVNENLISFLSNYLSH